MKSATLLCCGRLHGASIFPMSDSCIKEIENYGFYTLYLNGHLFFLEVVPQSEADRSIYLNKLCKEHKIGGSIYAYLQEIFYIDLMTLRFVLCMRQI